MKMHYIIVHYLQQWVNLNFDRSRILRKKNYFQAFLKGNMRLAIVKQCDISAGEFAACLDLSFHLCINLFSPGILLQKASYFPCCSWISSVICYSFWRPYLNGNGLTLTIHSCLHIFQSVLSSIFYLSLLSCTSRDPLLACSRAPSLLLLLCTVSFVSETPHECCCFYYYLHLGTCFFLLSSFILHFTRLPSLTTQLSVWSSIHPQTPFPPEEPISLSLHSTDSFLFISLLLYHNFFIFHSIIFLS